MKSRCRIRVAPSQFRRPIKWGKFGGKSATNPLFPSPPLFPPIGSRQRSLPTSTLHPGRTYLVVINRLQHSNTTTDSKAVDRLFKKLAWYYLMSDQQVFQENNLVLQPHHG